MAKTIAPPPEETPENGTPEIPPPPPAAALTNEELAQLAYAAYASKIIGDGGLSLPIWAGLTEATKEGWRAAAVAVSAVV